METCPLGPEECYKIHYLQQDLSAVRESKEELKRQLAQQAALLGKALEVVRGVAVGTCLTDLNHELMPKFVRSAQALIPDLEKALEKKP